MFTKLIEQGLVKQKRYDNGLSVFKYTRKVFYDALWETDPLLLEARGMVLDDEGNKVIWPFTKIFNYKENGTGLNLDPNHSVRIVEKLNGFMAASRIYKDEFLVSTTGTLDSDYALLARMHIEKLNTGSMLQGYTYLFEICDPSDPHIVKEVEGAYLIGMRDMETGRMLTEEELDREAHFIGVLRPSHWVCTFQEALESTKVCTREGFMIRSGSGETLMKIKSPHYLTKKFLMRMGQKKVDVMFSNMRTFREWIDEEFYDASEWIVSNHTQEQWEGMTDQQRRYVIEGYFNG